MGRRGIEGEIWGEGVYRGEGRYGDIWGEGRYREIWGEGGYRGKYG